MLLSSKPVRYKEEEEVRHFLIMKPTARAILSYPRTAN